VDEEESVKDVRPSCVGDDELCTLLLALTGSSFSSIPTSLYGPIVHVIDGLQLCGVFKEEGLMQCRDYWLQYLGCDCFICLISDHHLIQIGEVRQQFSNSLSTSKLNVYKESSDEELGRCVDATRALEARIRALQEEFPENNVLEEVISSIERFFASSRNQPLMRVASLLEKLLGECLEWSSGLLSWMFMSYGFSVR